MKKGISSLVMTIILIFITVVAVATIYYAIEPMLIKSQQDMENQTAGNFYKFINLCGKDCEELGMAYKKAFNNSVENKIDCYCIYENSRGGIPIRIWQK